MSIIKCPYCGSDNITASMNGFYCEDCGEEFFNLKKIKSAGKDIFKSISQLLDILKK